MSCKAANNLPLPAAYDDDATYVNDLLSFVTSSTVLQTLVTSVHIVDFFTSASDMYETVLDRSWRQWFELHDMDTLLDFLIREDVSSSLLRGSPEGSYWRGELMPPPSLLEYLASIRSLALSREFRSAAPPSQMTKQLSVGMKPKKMHEVANTARYVRDLTTELGGITHLVDFGAGQGYLGRFLASEPVNRHVIAVESKGNNVHAAKAMDASVKLAPKSRIMRNKKQYKQELAARKKDEACVLPSYQAARDIPEMAARGDLEQNQHERGAARSLSINGPIRGRGSVRHVEHRLQDGNLQDIVNGLNLCRDGEMVDTPLATGQDQLSTQANHRQPEGTPAKDPRLLVMSLHSCGNLSHHALRSLVLNPTVKAVAVIGCCYNLMTERFGPPSYKSEYLRPNTSTDADNTLQHSDAQGFPMSQRLSTYPSADGHGLSLNITARMMAVQAPSNWSNSEADAFFTRHFFRALLQRVLVDRGITDPPIPNPDQSGDSGLVSPRSPAGGGASAQPIIVGSLNKAAYRDFATYARAAVERVASSSTLDEDKLSKLNRIFGEDLSYYSREFEHRKKHVGIVWTLMALSATLVEATIVVDRWLWLNEQQEVDRCWVEAAFDYHQSPRNLVVVGIKRCGLPTDKSSDSTKGNSGDGGV